MRQSYTHFTEQQHIEALMTKISSVLVLCNKKEFLETIKLGCMISIFI